MRVSSQPGSDSGDRLAGVEKRCARNRAGPILAGQAVRRLVDGIANDFITKATANEWQYVVSGWFNPRGLYDAAIEHEIYGDRFLDPQAGYVYAYVAACAERGVDPNVHHCAGVAEELGDVDLTERELAYLLLTVDYCAEELHAYADGVAFNASRRERAQKLYREYVELVGGDVFDVSVRRRQSISQRQRTVIPKTLKRRRR